MDQPAGPKHVAVAVQRPLVFLRIRGLLFRPPHRFDRPEEPRIPGELHAQAIGGRREFARVRLLLEGQYGPTGPPSANPRDPAALLIRGVSATALARGA